MTGWVGDPTTGSPCLPSPPVSGTQPLVQQRRPLRRSPLCSGKRFWPVETSCTSSQPVPVPVPVPRPCSASALRRAWSNSSEREIKYSPVPRLCTGSRGRLEICERGELGGSGIQGPIWAPACRGPNRPEISILLVDAPGFLLVDRGHPSGSHAGSAQSSAKSPLCIDALWPVRFTPALSLTYLLPSIIIFVSLQSLPAYLQRHLSHRIRCSTVSGELREKKSALRTHHV
jgi:hypothetical protein